MKRTWRWPLAGFLLGGLVGATFLTVNVVGASSPNAPPGKAASFGEILHTPPLLARVGKAVELSFGVVWRTHFTTPVFMSTAMTALVIFCGGSA